MKKRWEEEEIKEYLQKSAEEEEIPKSLKPEEIKKRLAALDKKKEGKGAYRWWYGTVAAACLFFVIFAAGDKLFPVPESSVQKENAEESEEEGTTYEQLYQTFSKIWNERRNYDTDNRNLLTVDESSAENDAAVMEKSAQDLSSSAQGASRKEKSEDYGKTNQQEAKVEEADIVKNDGRFLYHVICSPKDKKYRVQITDTRSGLQRVSEAGGFEDIQDFYVWKDKLVILEQGWAEPEWTTWTEKKAGMADVWEDMDYEENSFVKIHVYDIADKEKPREYHTFTIKGDYKDSRISDGYLYFFVQNRARRPQKKEDYRAYIPMLDDEPMKAERIFLPQDSNADSYLVMASIDMKNPKEFKDTMAIVTSADQFYASTENLYVADSRYPDISQKEKRYDSTKIYRFSYKKGKIKKEAEGTVKGILRDDMAMSEKNGYLRLVTTVSYQQMVQITDDISGEDLGYASAGGGTSNSLYILNKKLKTVGKIENLAEGEQIYSARFLGDIGYFVTFRETDPLFSADLSDPKHPKILGELKISGFSEYLHSYREDLLLGIGMEADEESGITQGMKLSMFNTKDPADVKEESRLNLSEYDSAQALYDYKAVLIDTDKNLFGFLAEGYREEIIEDYLLFSYEDGEFHQMMKIDCSDNEKYAGEIRGTYIGEYFYLLCQNGRVEEYSLQTGEMTGELEY